MIQNRRLLLKCLLGVTLMNSIQGCATTDANEPVFHGFEIELDKSVKQARNIVYSYGDDMVKVKKPSAIPMGAWTSYMAPMRIPEEFEVSWETPDGQKYAAKVPVRSRLPGSIKNKSIRFVIKQGYVEGYVVVYAEGPAKKELFVTSAKSEANSGTSKESKELGTR